MHAKTPSSSPYAQPSRTTTLENCVFSLRFFQTSVADNFPPASAFTCKSTLPSPKPADNSTRSPSSVSGCAHRGPHPFQLYCHWTCPSAGLCAVRLVALSDNTSHWPQSVATVGEL